MLIVHPDFDHRIDLPGAGPCPRPVDIDRARTGFADLVSLRVYSFAAGSVIDGEAEEDEVFIVLMRGRVALSIAVDGVEAGAFVLDEEAAMRAAFMPPRAAYRLSAERHSDVAYARAHPTGPSPAAVRGFAAHDGRIEVAGHATGMDLALTLADADGAPVSGPARERFVHVRSEHGDGILLAGARLGDWDAAILDPGDPADFGDGDGDVLLVTAAGH